ncbi:DMT family transporter [Gordoniibacillus kamchatkensis]|uniref:DMT family transporter n=1 Tax=Gordoniibacillus kamchatkensis TaxID=1590651 RepID=UPI000696AD9A|nr:DMT family transporter [Paenibacillus sp. VKM B-2647]
MYSTPSLSKPKPAVPVAALVIVGIIAISFSAIFVKWSQAPASALAMNRLLLTCLLMTPWLWKHRAEWRELTARTAGRLALSGLMLGLHFLLWMESLRYTTVASSTALLTLEPVFVMLGSLLAFRQRTAAGAVVGMIIAIAGAALIGWGDFRFSGPALKGDILSVLGTLAMAANIVLGKSLRGHVSTFVYSYAVFLAAAVLLAGYAAVLGVPLFAYDAKEWGIFLLLALVPTLLGHYVFNALLKYMRATSVSMTVLGEPLGATLLAYVLLGETVTSLQAVAGGVLLLGVWQFMRTIESK